MVQYKQQKRKDIKRTASKSKAGKYEILKRQVVFPMHSEEEIKEEMEIEVITV